jgi:hypothetical protein
MDLDVQLWLARKTIDENHLKEIEQLARALDQTLPGSSHGSSSTVALLANVGDPP